MEQLTDKQHEILTFIADYLRDHQSAPAIREIADHFGFSSPKAATDHVNALVRKGYLLKVAGISRGLRLTADAEELVRGDEGIPVVGDVAAGLPILAIEHIQGFLDMNAMFGNRKGLYAVRVRGNSMVNAGIHDGDHVIVRQSPMIENGAIGVAYVEGDATVKRIYRDGKSVRLVPENDAMDPIVIDETCPDFSVGGQVVGVVRNVR